MRRIANRTKHEQLKEILKEELLSGKYPPGAKFYSQNKLAEDFGLSPVTAREAIAALVQEGFLTRSQGKGTFVADFKKLRTHRTVGVVIDTEEHTHPLFTRHLPSQLQFRGYFTMLMDIRNNIKPHLEKFLEEKYFGLIVDGYSVFPFETLENLKETARLIFIHRFEGPKKYKAAYVLSDYVKGGYLAAKHLLKNGRKNILILSFEIKPGWTSDLFYQGCLKAQKEYGGEFTYINTEETPLEKTCYERFKSRVRPDGVIALLDAWLIPVVKILQDLKLRVPDDVALIGYNNTPWAEAYNLTSVSRNEMIITEKTVEILEDGRNEEIYVEPEIVFRNSCPKDL